MSCFACHFLLLLVTPLAAVSLTTNTTQLHGLREWVSVKFSVEDKDSRKGCFIGLWVPSNASVSAVFPPPKGSTYGDMPATATAPAKYILCSDADPNFMASGSGVHEFRVLNMRVPSRFHLFTNGTSYPVLSASSQELHFEKTKIPMHGHIARTLDASEMLVQWESASASSPEVQWGFESGSLNYSAPATSSTYGIEDLCGFPANKEGWFAPPFFHRAVVTGLKPSVQVFYRFGSSENGWSDERSFRAAPPVAADTPVYLLLTGDVGATEPDSCTAHWSDPIRGQERTSNLTILHLTQAPQADLLLHVGDLSYATGYLAKWDLFLDQIEGVASRTPYMTMQGNHERDWPSTGTIGGEDSGGECGVATQHRFAMPVPSRKQEAGWYSVDVGSVHIVAIETELPCGQGSEQYAFLKADLAGVDRSRTPWVVVSGHRPMYTSSSTGSSGPSSSFCSGGGDLEPLLFNNKVDLALWGHVHNAIRTCPVLKGKCVSPSADYDAPIHAVIGNGGQVKSGVDAKAPEWLKFASGEWGWEQLRVYNSTHLHMDFFDESNNLLHAFDIVRNFPRQY